MINKRCICW